MLGSASSISDTNVMLNTMIADVFSQFADRLEQASDFDAELQLLIRETLSAHKRIIFNGDGYSEEWKKEAQRRELLNLESTVDALPLLKTEENIALFERHGVLNRAEINSRVDIVLENYSKILHIEALTLIEMMNREVIPAISEYTNKLCSGLINKRSLGIKFDDLADTEIIARLSAASAEIYRLTGDLKMEVMSAEKIPDMLERAVKYHDVVLKLMNDIRKYADSSEAVVSKECWPYPSYGELLFSI